MIDTILQGLGLKKTTILLGLIGALVALKWIEAVGVWARTFAVFTGFVTAQVATPITLHFFQFTSEYEGGVSFAIGLFGMSIIGSVMKAIKEANLWQLICQWFGKK